MAYSFVFSTGRTGTAYLTQIFGGGKFEKRRVYNPSKDNFVIHEYLNNRPIKDLKKQKDLFDTDIGNVYLDKRLSQYKNVFIFDHTIGRFISQAYPESKILRINKDHELVAKSFLKRFEERKKVYTKEQYKHFYNSFWYESAYMPTDKFIKSDIDWEKMSDQEKFMWYSKETQTQWELNKHNYSNFMEIEFEDIFIRQNDISDFLGISYNKKLSKEKVNE